MERRKEVVKDSQEKKQLRLVVLIVVGTVAFMIIAALIAFFITIKGPEQTMVPDVIGTELENAMIELQDKGLNSRVQLQYSSSPADKGIVLGQEPSPSSLVKAGSDVVLKVSRGAIIDRVEDYVGWNLNDLEIHLQTLFTTYGPLLRIKKPVMRIFNEAPAGTILEQKPKPGTEISGVTDLELVVSRGPEEEMITVVSYVGMPFMEVLKKLADEDIPFVFSSRPAEGDENPGVIISQSPDPGTPVPPGTLRQLIMTEPEDILENHVFGILEKTLPDYPVAVDMELEAITYEGDRKTIFTMKHPGGAIAIPYLEEANTMLILSVFDREIIRQTIRPPIQEEEEESSIEPGLGSGSDESEAESENGQ